MKQRILAAIAALAMSLSLVGCHSSTPATVGYIGDIEITAGIYLISQFQAYQTALGYASDEQAALSNAKFLKETIYLLDDGTVAPTPEEGEEQTGEAWLVSDLVESETLANLEYYAAVETMFAALNGVLTAEELETADSYASQLWDYYGDLYEANGIGENTVVLYQYTSMKSSALLNLIYGTDGTEAISDADLTTLLSEEMVYAEYVSVPMYNTSDYTFADETQQDEIIAALDVALAEYETLMSEDGADPETSFFTALTNNITAAYDVMGSEFDTSTLSDTLAADLYSYTDLEEYFDEDSLALVMALEYNEATAFKADYTSGMAFLRIDPLENGYTLDDLRDTILMEMKSDELVTLVEETGAALANNLDASVMSRYPAKKVVNE